MLIYVSVGSARKTGIKGGPATAVRSIDRDSGTRAADTPKINRVKCKKTVDKANEI